VRAPPTSEAWEVDVTRIRVAVLSMVGDGEGRPFQRQARAVPEVLVGPGALPALPASTGADARSRVDHLPLAQEVVLDWLDEVFEPEPAAPGLATSLTRR
jgi:hypothetical protein